MQTVIRYYWRSVYGQNRLYLANASQAETVATLTRRKTVEQADLLALQTLGCTLENVPDPRTWLAPSNVAALRQA